MTHDKLLVQAREHWKIATGDQAERDNRERGREDAKFAAGDQWDPATIMERDLSGRPYLTFNRMNGYLHQVENEVRQNRIGIKISPTSSGVSKDTADVDQGLIRRIQYDSKSDTAMQSVLVEQCRSGLGAFKLDSRYVADDSFDQELYIEQIPDAIHRVFWDPYCKQPDKSDSDYMFEMDVLSQEEFKTQFPDCETSTSNFFDGGYGNFNHDWVTDEGVRVANYWYAEYKKRKRVLLSDGIQGFKDELGEWPAEITIVKERDVIQRTLHCAKINGVEVLEEYEWRGQTIPIFPVVGEEMYVDGQLRRYSLLHFAKDPQRLYNFYRTNEAEVVGLAPRSPWIVAEGQLEDYEEQWKRANKNNYAFLTYKPTTIAGEAVGRPERNTYEPPIQALSQGAAQAAEDMKATLSMYDASVGARSNETSGVAINARKREGDQANLHYVDNLARSICSCGRGIVEVKKYYYDTDREIEIIGEDEKPKVVRINAPHVDEQGQPQHYELAKSDKYKVAVSAGPSLETKRLDAWEAMTEWARSYPPLMQIAGDIIFENSDFPGGDRIAERLKKTLPPNLADDGKDKNKQIPPQVQQQMAAQAQQIEALTTALHEASTALETKKLELDSKERIAALQGQVSLAETAAKLGSAEALADLQHEVAAIGARLARLDALKAQQDQMTAAATPAATPAAGPGPAQAAPVAPNAPVAAPAAPALPLAA